MSSELGEIDEALTKKTVERIRPALMQCYESGLDRVAYMGGDLKFFLRVKADGHLRWGFVELTTLGDRQTETCMLDVLSATHWPLPEGGEAEVHQALGFDAPPGGRTPLEWSADRVALAVGKKSQELASCKKHGPGAFQITAYVAADHGVGHIVAAGASAPNLASAADVDCILGVVRSLKLPSPGSTPAKVSFSE